MIKHLPSFEHSITLCNGLALSVDYQLSTWYRIFAQLFVIEFTHILLSTEDSFTINVLQKHNMLSTEDSSLCNVSNTIYIENSVTLSNIACHWGKCKINETLKTKKTTVYLANHNLTIHVHHFPFFPLTLTQAVNWNLPCRKASYTFSHTPVPFSLPPHILPYLIHTPLMQEKALGIPRSSLHMTDIKRLFWIVYGIGLSTAQTYHPV